jgi:hypothetical protein
VTVDLAALKVHTEGSYQLECGLAGSSTLVYNNQNSCNFCISSRVCPHIPPCDIQIMKVRIWYRDTPTPNSHINKCDMSSKVREVTSYFYVIPKRKRENSTMTRFSLQKSGVPEDCQFQNTPSWNFNYVFNLLSFALKRVATPTCRLDFTYAFESL